MIDWSIGSFRLHRSRIDHSLQIFTQTVLALRVPGGFSSDLGGAGLGQFQVYGCAFLMQIICIRDIYPSKTNGKQGVAKIYPHKTQCLRDSTLAKHSVFKAPMSKTHNEITIFWDFMILMRIDHNSYDFMSILDINITVGYRILQRFSWYVFSKFCDRKYSLKICPFSKNKNL